MYKIMVVSDHRILRQGLRVLLERTTEFEVLADSDFQPALALIEELHPNVVVLDINPANVDPGVQLLSEIKHRCSDVRVVTLVPNGASPALMVRTVRAGAAGYVAEDTGDIIIVAEAIRKVAQGQLFLSNLALVALMDSIINNDQMSAVPVPRDRDALSPREYEVINLVALGYTNRQIGLRLFISESTARTHVHNILDKLRLSNRVEIAALAHERRLVAHDPADSRSTNGSTSAAAGR